MAQRIDKNSMNLLMSAKSAMVYVDPDNHNKPTYIVRLDLGKDRYHYLHGGDGIMIWHDAQKLRRSLARKRPDMPICIDRLEGGLL